MLCYRCEHRAKYLEKLSESKHSDEEMYVPRPRYECGEIDKAVNGCYMFKPVKPIVIKPRDGDSRPITLNMLSCRVERVDDVKIELELRSEQINNSVIFYWAPKKNEE